MDTKKLRQKILDLAIHGKLVPQDPNDEPASVLLERIKAEKERLIKEGKIKRSKKSGSSDTLHYENVPFEVPSSWVWCRLEDITVLIEDCPHTTAKDEGKGYPLVRTPNIGEGQLLLDGVHRVSKEVYDKRNVRAVPQVDDIIYAREAPAGNVAVIRENEQVCLGQRTVLIRPMNTLIDSVWLTYAMLTPYSRNHLISKATGSTVTHVNMASIRPFDLPLPPLSEQHRIVAEIKRWFALIDQIEQGKADLQTIIKQTKSKILDLAIHGKLVPQDPNDEPAIELLKRINPDFTPCDNEHYQNLPKGWCIVLMQMLCSLTDGEKQSGIERINLDVKYLRGERDAKMLSTGKYITENSLLILVDGENSGEVFQTPTEGYQGSTFKQLSINNNMNTDYMLQVINLHRKTLRENKVGSAIPHLNKKLFRAIEVPMPPYDEQHRIINVINVAYKHLDAIMENL
ncbi:restriction endonuclease subunit S [Bacteroides cellulosilyticus]|uniref:Restriction endonuclease subunit S n=5 Tax=Bacteroides cellulosilyticus TaxID=246787 RepID=A0A6L3K2E7_9BACE|nr:restriction endonuclease subunit S [Bacteroides cellulosilyticus]KAA5419397.1 restriction endonuclease subunit S [Bacteroides cellulosilyticus]